MKFASLVALLLPALALTAAPARACQFDNMPGMRHAPFSPFASRAPIMAPAWQDDEPLVPPQVKSSVNTDPIVEIPATDSYDGGDVEPIPEGRITR